MQKVRDLGHYPKESIGRSLEERQLARQVRGKLKTKQFSLEEEAELSAMQQAEALEQAEQEVDGSSTGGASRRILDAWYPPDWREFSRDDQEDDLHCIGNDAAQSASPPDGGPDVPQRPSSRAWRRHWATATTSTTAPVATVALVATVAWLVLLIWK